jgi:tetratricopeptide (TPR) repeat protein
MAKKKHTQPAISQEENAQARHAFEQYHELARKLRLSKDQQQVEEALAEVNQLPIGTQMALVKELARERHTEAADVLVALNEYASLKEVRKEARRALLQLEGAKVYPNWQAPIERGPALGIAQLSTNPPRFWKGIVTDSRAVGEVSLFLCWEQGEEYREVRVLGFLLEFWHDGVKDFLTTVESKKGADRLIAEMTAELETPTKPCSLARGRRLLDEALEANSRHGTKPHRDYQLNRSLVNQLMPPLSEEEEKELEREEAEEVEKEIEEELRDLKPIDVVSTFISAWVGGDYDTAYLLLAPESPLREGVSKDEWIERREEWNTTFIADELQPGLLFEREAPGSKLWLPFSRTPEGATREVEVSWSVELAKTPAPEEKLPELPEPSVVYPETGRHWFWASFTLVQVDGQWRIQSMTDEVMKARELPVEEIERRVQELDKAAKKHAEGTEPSDLERMSEQEVIHLLAETLKPLLQKAFYLDALLLKGPRKRERYDELAAMMMFLSQHERSLVYLTVLAEQFAEEHEAVYGYIAEAQQKLSDRFFEEGDDERGEHFLELAEQSLRQSLAVKDTWQTRIDLAELMMKDERLDEAEEHLLEAKKQVSETKDEALVEYHLGEIETEREEYQKALGHFQRIVELQPDVAESWAGLGRAQQNLKNYEEAEASLKRAIELDPKDPDFYSSLGLLYADQDQHTRAIATLEEGVRANPDLTDLYMPLVIANINAENFQQAEKWLDKLEEVDPEAEFIPVYRQLIKQGRRRVSPASFSPKKLTGPKKREPHRRHR